MKGGHTGKIARVNLTDKSVSTIPTEKYVEEKYKINKAKTNRAEFRKLCLKEAKKVETVYPNCFITSVGNVKSDSVLGSDDR